MPIKSVHITNYYHKDSGGISTAYNKLLEAANRRERHVRLIVPGAETSIEKVGDFARIYYVKAGFSPVFDKRYRLMLPWKTYIFENAPIKAILRDEQPDLIEIGEKYTLSLMGGLLRKHILTVSTKRPILVHSSCERMDDNVRSFIGDGKVLNWLTRRYIGNYIVPMFDFHLTNSKYTCQELIDSASATENPRRSKAFFNFCWRLWRTPVVDLKDRLFVNQCGVDNELFSPVRRSPENRSKILQEYGLPEDAVVLLYAGRISPEKNIGLLIKVIEVLRKDTSHDFRLLVAGGGPSADTLALEAEKFGPGIVNMLGQIGDKEQLANLFANCDAFVHPNPQEPFGITPLEAMASGSPVVAPNAGGVLSYSDSENAWLAEPDAESFAAAVIDIFSDETRKKLKVEKAIETSRRFSWKDSTDALFEIYDKMHAMYSVDPALYDYDEPAKNANFSELATSTELS